MPVRANGAEARITFGLSDAAQVTSLCGIGFFMKTRAVLSFSNSEDPALVVQPLGLNLPVTYETPSVRPLPTRRDVTKTYLQILPAEPIGPSASPDEHEIKNVK